MLAYPGVNSSSFMFGVGCKMQGIILQLFADHKHLFLNGILLFNLDLFTIHWVYECTHTFFNLLQPLHCTKIS